MMIFLTKEKLERLYKDDEDRLRVSCFMNGNLEPDELVLDDSVRYGGMLGRRRNWGGSMVMRLM